MRIYILYIYTHAMRVRTRCATTRTQSNAPKSASTLFGDCAHRYFSRAVSCAMMVYRAAFEGGRSVAYMYMHSTHALGGARTHARERRRSHSRANECRASARQRHFLIEIFLGSSVGDRTPCGAFISPYFRVCAGGAPQSLYKFEYIGVVMDVLWVHHPRWRMGVGPCRGENHHTWWMMTYCAVVVWYDVFLVYTSARARVSREKYLYTDTDDERWRRGVV